MQLIGDRLRLSATDLANYLGCRHLTMLDRLAAMGQIEKPIWRDPGLEALRQRGREHETAYVRYPQSGGRSICDLQSDGRPVSPFSTASTPRHCVGRHALVVKLTLDANFPSTLS